MKLSIIVVFILFAGCNRRPAAPVSGMMDLGPTETADLGAGTIELPKGYIHIPGGRVDSTMGDLKSADGSVNIRYDIGPMAGFMAADRTLAVVDSGSLMAGHLIGEFVVMEEPHGEDVSIVSFRIFGGVNFIAHSSKKHDVDLLKAIASTFKPHDLKQQIK